MDSADSEPTATRTTTRHPVHGSPTPSGNGTWFAWHPSHTLPPAPIDLSALDPPVSFMHLRFWRYINIYPYDGYGMRRNRYFGTMTLGGEVVIHPDDVDNANCATIVYWFNKVNARLAEILNTLTLDANGYTVHVKDVNAFDGAEIHYLHNLRFFLEVRIAQLYHQQSRDSLRYFLGN
jgi:hypothetical protein